MKDKEMLKLQAELEATNRQVEILSDALAESRREVAALKAVQEPVAYEYGEEVYWHTNPALNDYIRANGKELVYATPPAAPVQPCNPAEDGVCEALECCKQPAPVQEPVAYRSVLASGSYTYCNTPQFFDNAEPLYTTPPAAQRQWVGLSQDELNAMFSNTIKGKKLVNWVARSIEAKLKEKNT